MTVRSESRTEIAAPPSSVHGYLADVARWPEWASAIVECGVAGGGPLEAGARLEQRVKKMGGSTGSRTLDVTAVEAPSQLGFAGSMGPTPIRWGFDVAPADGGTSSVTLWIEADRRGVMRALPAGVLRSMFRHVNQRELLAIKKTIEAAPQANHATTSA